MKKNSIYLAAMLIIVFVSCKKQSDSSMPNSGSHGNGGYGVAGITGLSDITLSKNTDTTITIPISAQAIIYGNWTPDITIHFGSLPANVVSVMPLSYSAMASKFSSDITKPFAFHINAIDAGTSSVVVLATTSGGFPSEASASFLIVVH